VTLLRKAAISEELVFPVLPEAAGLLVGGFMMGAELYEIRFAARPPVQADN
jgi:hypothetical protein